MSKVAIRMGHMNCGVDGASNGLLNEYDIIRDYAPYVIKALQRSGIEVIDVTPSNSDITLTGNAGMMQSLGYGVDKANASEANIFVSCHVNAFDNPDARGCEVVYGSEWEKKLGQCILDELVGLGFLNRGVKPNDRGLYEIKATNMSTVIVEPFFCTSQKDIDIYNNVGAKGLGEAIARGICTYLGETCVEETVVQEPIPQETVANEENPSGTVTFTQVYAGNLEAIFEDANGAEYIGTVKLDSIVKK